MKRVVKSSLELRFEELTALVLKAKGEKCGATALLAHFVSGNLDQTLANLGAAGYWKPDAQCSAEEQADRCQYGKPWYLLTRYMDDVQGAMKRQQQSALGQPYRPSHPLRDDPVHTEGRTTSF